MLRVEFIYCRPLVVPFVRGFMIGLLRQLDPDPSNLLCYAAGRVPIRTVGTAPMQSDFPRDHVLTSATGDQRPRQKFNSSFNPFGSSRKICLRPIASESCG